MAGNAEAPQPTLADVTRLLVKYREALKDLLAEMEDRQDVEGDSEHLRPNFEMQMADRIRRVLP